MVKAIAVSVSVVLLLSSSTFGQGGIYQAFDFDTSLGSTLVLAGGPGAAFFSQDLMLGNDQITAGVGTTTMPSMDELSDPIGSGNGMPTGLVVDQMLLAGNIDPSVMSFDIPNVEGPVQDVGASLGTIGQSEGVVVAWPTDGAYPSTEWQAMPTAWVGSPIDVD